MKQVKPFILLMSIMALLVVALPAVASSPAGQPGNECRRHVSIERWNTQRQIEAQGFHFFVEDSGTSSLEGETIRLSVASDPEGDYSVGRINEVNTDAPVNERVKCWQPSADQRIEAEYRIRWGSDGVNESLTETAYLGNAAPIDFNPEAKFTAVGVVRSPMLAELLDGYAAVVAQDVYVGVDGRIQGFLALGSLEEIDATEWHTVRLTLWEQRARIEIEQDGTTVVFDQTVLMPIVAMGMEFSLDNELLPGQFAPIVTGDTLEIDYYRIRVMRN